jgi:hypothetical protein
MQWLVAYLERLVFDVQQRDDNDSAFAKARIEET